jgi:hypothetical protein
MWTSYPSQSRGVMMFNLEPSLETRLVNVVWRAASQHDLDRLLVAVLPVKRVVVEGLETRDHGICDTSLGVIQIRVMTLHDKKRQYLQVPTILDTAAHELAHLLEFRHDKNHRNLRKALKTWMVANWSPELHTMHKSLQQALDTGRVVL